MAMETKACPFHDQSENSSSEVPSSIGIAEDRSSLSTPDSRALESFRQHPGVLVNMPSMLTRDELRCWAHHIRDNLIPALNDGIEVALSTAALDGVENFLIQMKGAYVDIEVLRYSRIHNALREIRAMASRWTPRIALTAHELLSLWSKKFGPVEDIRLNLWRHGGRLEGIVKMKDWNFDNVRRDSMKAAGMVDLPHWKPAWNLELGKAFSHPLQTGHNGFEVGNWWINIAAAFRDGIIRGTATGITADSKGAYAILMTDEEEIETGLENIIEYQASPLDPDGPKLVKNLQSRELVRVLRNWELTSKLAPKAGLRYDGLYRVSGYGVKLKIDTSGNDEWHYTFTLERYADQLGMEKAFCHPNAEEMDDWNEYERLDIEIRENLGSGFDGTSESESGLWTPNDSPTYSIMGHDTGTVFGTRQAGEGSTDTDSSTGDVYQLNIEHSSRSKSL